MRNHSLIPYALDTRLKVEADSLPELFRAALEGMSHIMTPHTEEGTRSLEQELRIRDEVNLEAPDQTELLIDFLSEVLTLMHLKKVVYTSINFNSLSEKSLNARLSGYHISEFKEDIKAVTHDEALIEKNNNAYKSIIIFEK